MARVDYARTLELFSIRAAPATLSELTRALECGYEGQRGLDVQTRSYRFRSYESCFVAQEAVNWLIEYCNVRGIGTRRLGGMRGGLGEVTREQAAEFMDYLAKAGVFRPLTRAGFKDDNHLHRLAQHDEQGFILNRVQSVEPGLGSGKKTSVAAQVQLDAQKADASRSLQQTLPLTMSIELLTNVLNALKRVVPGPHICSANLAQVKADQGFMQALADTEKLRHAELILLNPIQMTCFFLNIYNLLALHACIELSHDEGNVPRSIFRACYQIGSLTFSLFDIEHRILRTSRSIPRISDPEARAAFMAKLAFKRTDPRRAFVCEEWDERINFALCTGAMSAPRIRIFRSGATLGKTLGECARDYIQRFTTVRIYRRKKVPDFEVTGEGNHEETWPPSVQLQNGTLNSLANSPASRTPSATSGVGTPGKRTLERTARAGSSWLASLGASLAPIPSPEHSPTQRPTRDVPKLGTSRFRDRHFQELTFGPISISLPHMFLWYADDFGGSLRASLEWALPFFPVSLQLYLLRHKYLACIVRRDPWVQVFPMTYSNDFCWDFNAEVNEKRILGEDAPCIGEHSYREEAPSRCEHYPGKGSAQDVDIVFFLNEEAQREKDWFAPVSTEAHFLQLLRNQPVGDAPVTIHVGDAPVTLHINNSSSASSSASSNGTQTTHHCVSGDRGSRHTGHNRCSGSSSNDGSSSSNMTEDGRRSSSGGSATTCTSSSSSSGDTSTTCSCSRESTSSNRSRGSNSEFGNSSSGSGDSCSSSCSTGDTSSDKRDSCSCVTSQEAMDLTRQLSGTDKIGDFHFTVQDDDDIGKSALQSPSVSLVGAFPSLAVSVTRESSLSVLSPHFPDPELETPMHGLFPGVFGDLDASPSNIIRDNVDQVTVVFQQPLPSFDSPHANAPSPDSPEAIPRRERGFVVSDALNELRPDSPRSDGTPRRERAFVVSEARTIPASPKIVASPDQQAKKERRESERDALEKKSRRESEKLKERKENERDRREVDRSTDRNYDEKRSKEDPKLRRTQSDRQGRTTTTTDGVGSSRSVDPRKSGGDRKERTDRKRTDEQRVSRRRSVSTEYPGEDEAAESRRKKNFPVRNSASLAYVIQEYARYFRDRFEPEVTSTSKFTSHPGFDGLTDTLAAIHYMAWSSLASNGLELEPEGPPGKLTCQSLLHLLEGHLYFLIFESMFAWYKRKHASLEVELISKRQSLRNVLSLTRLQVPPAFRLGEDPALLEQQAELEDNGGTELLAIPYRSVIQALSDLGRAGSDASDLCSPSLLLSRVVSLVDLIGEEITTYSKTSGEKFESLTSDDLLLVTSYVIGQTPAQGLNGMVHFLVDFLQHATEKKRPPAASRTASGEQKVLDWGSGVRAAGTERGPTHAFYVTPGYKDVKQFYSALYLGRAGFALASLSGALNYFVHDMEKNLCLA